MLICILKYRIGYKFMEYKIIQIKILNNLRVKQRYEIPFLINVSELLILQYKYILIKFIFTLDTSGTESHVQKLTRELQFSANKVNSIQETKTKQKMFIFVRREINLLCQIDLVALVLCHRAGSPNTAQSIAFNVHSHRDINKKQIKIYLQQFSYDDAML